MPIKKRNGSLKPLQWTLYALQRMGGSTGIGMQNMRTKWRKMNVKRRGYGMVSFLKTHVVTVAAHAHLTKNGS